MTRLTRIDELSQLPGPVALAIGVFDGLHRGHQEVVRAAVDHARQHNGTAVLMTFDPHPAVVLAPSKAPLRLTSARHQEVLASALGVRALLVCPFDREMADLSAEAFIESLVKACRPLGCVAVGYDWCFGRGRAGNVHRLLDAGAEAGFAVYGVPAVRDGLTGQVISSTWVREAVRGGDLITVERLLGRRFGYLGVVEKGRQLGRELGFPTANVRLDSEVHPPAGVYASRVKIAGQWHSAVCNLGRRPTVEEAGRVLLEAHVLDWTGDLYGQEVEVVLEHFVRAERRFDGLEALKAQIVLDTAQARVRLKV